MLSSVTFEPHGTAGGKSGDPTPNTALMGNPKNWNLIMSNLILSPSVNTQSEPNTNTGVFPLKVEKKPKNWAWKCSLDNPEAPGESRNHPRDGKYPGLLLKSWEISGGFGWREFWRNRRKKKNQVWWKCISALIIISLSSDLLFSQTIYAQLWH